MKPKYSLMVLFLLYLKGVIVETDTVSVHTESVCAPAGSSLTLWHRCEYPYGLQSVSWKHRSNNTETLVNPIQDSRYRYFEGSYHRCYLIIEGLKETDAGTYHLSFTYRKGNTIFTSIGRLEFTVHVTDLQVSVDSERVTEGQNITLTCKTSCTPKQTFIWFKNGVRLDLRYSSDQLHVSEVNHEDSGRYSCALKREEEFRSAEMLLSVTHVAYVSAGIITLSSLLTPVLLLLVCAALWMIRKKQQNLKRLEEKEQSKQNENVYENEWTPPVTFDLEEKGKSVHQEEEVQYSCVHFSNFTHAQCSATSEKEADVQYAQIALQHQNNSSKY